MNCCGNKRNQWNQESKGAAVANNTDQIHTRLEPEQKPRVFEYTGNGSLILSGVVTGTIYRFHYKGEKVTVDYSDSFAMMGERDLRVVI